jgi:hypothetical protein
MFGRTDRELNRGEETQEGKARCLGAQEDKEGGEEENRDKKSGAKARAHHARFVAAAERFGRQDRRSIDHPAGSNAHRAARGPVDNEMTKKKAVRMRVIVQRINQELAAKGQILLLAARHKMKVTHHFGEYYLVDLSGNVIGMDIDPEKLARKLGVLKKGEEVERKKLRRKTKPER